jgi:FMN-dependent NADH-azoreductase
MTTAEEATNFFMKDYEKKKAERRIAHIHLLWERIGELENRILKDQAEIINRRKEIDILLDEGDQ